MINISTLVIGTGVAPGIFLRGANSSDEGAKMWFSGYQRSQKSPKKSIFPFRPGASMLQWGGYSPPGATPDWIGEKGNKDDRINYLEKRSIGMMLEIELAQE